MSTRETSIRQAAQYVQQGAVVAYPAEACFGIGCAPDNLEALTRIRKMKGRSLAQGFILVGDSTERLSPYLDWTVLDAVTQKNILASWPGPVSWILPASSLASSALRGENLTMAVRVSAFITLRDLCVDADMPLVSTSANRAGQAPLQTAREVERVFGNEIDYILDLPVEGLRKPSQIIDAATQNIIRPA